MPILRTMNETIRSSVQRIRTIVAANMNCFALGFLLTAVLCGSAFTLAQIKITPSFWIYTHTSLSFTIGLLILMPILVYGLKSASTKSRGVSEVTFNVTVMKKNLFLAAGVVWVSAGVLVLMTTYEEYDNVKYLASGLLVLGWWFINEIIISYVKDI